MSSTVGYSGRPLAAKLGIVAGSRVCALAAPTAYRALLAPVPEGVTFAPAVSRQTDVKHLFATERAQLAAALSALRTDIRSDSAVWVSWPKKSSKVTTDITEDAIRAVALPLGFVDVKVCAVSEVWSGLKLVIRKELR